MNQNQKGRTIFVVIAVIAFIALLCLLGGYIFRSVRAGKKANEIAEEIKLRTQLYCPQVPMDRIPDTGNKKYTQNGPYGVTIILQSEEHTPQIEGKKDTFSVLVDASHSKALCKKLIQSDVLEPQAVTIDGKEDGKCPGIIRFYFTCPYQLHEDMPVDYEPAPQDVHVPHPGHMPPHFTFTKPPKNPCRYPTPYEDIHGKCVACLTASQCDETQDCINNDCRPCPDFSSRIVRIGQRIGTRHCYCNEGYQLNADKNGCVAETHEWDSAHHCVGNHCTVCPKNAGKNSGIRIGSTDCYCKEGYLPHQVNATQWQCSKVEILYPEAENQIIVHDEKYTVEPPKPVVPEIPVAPQPKPQVIRDEVLSHYQQPTQPNVFFEPVFIPQPVFLPFPTGGYFDIQGWESLEITIQ